MLPSWLVRLVLAAALAVLPLQGAAETLKIMLCQPQSAKHARAAHADHPQHGAAAHSHAGAQHAHGHEHAAAGELVGSDPTAMSDAASGDDYAGHFCCDIVVAALPVSSPNLTRFDFSALELERELLHASVFLESPQRPPLA